MDHTLVIDPADKPHATTLIMLYLVAATLWTYVGMTAVNPDPAYMQAGAMMLCVPLSAAIRSARLVRLLYLVAAVELCSLTVALATA